MPPDRRPRRRPPWWPEGEEWPPRDWHAAWRGRGGPWRGRRGRGGPWRGRGGWGPPFGCLLAGLVLFGGGTLTLAIWAIAALVGLVSAPAIVVFGGLLALVVVAIAALVALRAVRATLTPVGELADAAERIESGDLSVRVSESGPPRMRVLARAFNQMSARLEQSDAARRAFLADAAHELRTPLAIIKGQVEAIEDGVYPADREHMRAIDDQIAALERLIDDLRTVALAEAGALELDLRPLDLAASVDEVLNAFAGEASAAGVELAADIPPRLPPAMADEARVNQILRNLLSNALRHTGRGDRITVSVAADGEWLRLTVADTGSGIPADRLERVFERFSKEPGSPGSGLGLAICRDLVEAHGGSIEIASQEGGTRVTFSLAVADSGR